MERTEEIHVRTPPSLINWIPFDLMREILVRLPARSLMRFRCVSKLWAYVTSDPDFIISFMAHSCSRSCLLLNFQKNDKQLFLSLSQHNNLEMCFPQKYPLELLKEDRYTPNFQFQSVHGLISFHYLYHIVIWNPSVRQHVTIVLFQKPAADEPMYMKSYLGYDPIGNTYKVLSMPYGTIEETQLQVLTLGAQESWRPVNSIPRHSLAYKGICINGVLYFIVITEGTNQIISFDVRTEKFKSIQTHSRMQDDLMDTLSLVSYKGRLAWVISLSSFYKLWVLEDAEKEEWSCQDFHIPYSPHDPIAKVGSLLSGVTDDGEFIYVSVSWQDKEIYVSYYDPKRNSNRRIKVEIFDEDNEFWLRDHDWEFIGSMPNHIENLMSLKNFNCVPFV